MKYKKLLIFLMAASLLTNSGSYTVFASQADAAASVFESMEADAGLSAAESSESQAEENSESSGSSESAESSAEGESGSGEVVNPEDQSGESTAGDDSLKRRQWLSRIQEIIGWKIMENFGRNPLRLG